MSQTPPTDTQRLDFMLTKSRKVVVEIVGYGFTHRPYSIYVEEGFMGEFQYPAVHWQEPNEAKFNDTSEEVLNLKRQAIDLAINHHSVNKGL